VVSRSTPALHLKESDEQQLRQWLSAFGTPQQVSLRSQIVLAAAEGFSDNGIARRLEVNRKTVTLWRARYEQEGLDSLWEVRRGAVADRPTGWKRSSRL
jgi:FixJ family two-component response regulator